MSFAATLEPANFHVAGERILGIFYGAAGETPRPTAILLHGAPGLEKNLDIAYELRDQGWNCLLIHHRGSWGSEGRYTFSGLVEDVQAATAWVLKQPAVDSERLTLVGMSMGGYISLLAGAVDQRIKAIAALCPLVDPNTVSISADWFENLAMVVSGVTGSELAAQWADLLPLQTFKAQLGRCPVLVVTGDQDTTFPPEHYERFMQAMPHIVWRRLGLGDHAFSACRKVLVATVVSWLIDTLGK